MRWERNGGFQLRGLLSQWCRKMAKARFWNKRQWPKVPERRRGPHFEAHHQRRAIRRSRRIHLRRRWRPDLRHIVCWRWVRNDVVEYHGNGPPNIMENLTIAALLLAPRLYFLFFISVLAMTNFGCITDDIVWSPSNYCKALQDMTAWGKSYWK